jgi:hypothetical protein
MEQLPTLAYHSLSSGGRMSNHTINPAGQVSKSTNKATRQPELPLRSVSPAAQTALIIGSDTNNKMGIPG